MLEVVDSCFYCEMLSLVDKLLSTSFWKVASFHDAHVREYFLFNEQGFDVPF